MKINERPLAGALIVLMLTSSLSGCISWGNDKLEDQANLERIVAGKTTKAEIENVLGPPMNRRSTSMGPHVYEWWAYSYSTSVVNPLEYLLLIGLFVNGIGTPDTRRDLQVFFDPDGTVRSLTQQTVSYELRAIRPNKITAETTTVGLSAPYRHEGVIRYHDKQEFQSR
jgi:outer membrane protein assembly factor BamE (lipoprotein component of BamABCDE complex)